MRNELKAEAIRYFAGKPVMVICIKQIHKKYESFGRFTGTISKSLFKKVDDRAVVDVHGHCAMGMGEKQKHKNQRFQSQLRGEQIRADPF